ncbi:hypothetical protein [Rhizobium leguminosarum]|uniref:hypothetical protein n=1 Tax=Rhizobium leguminosarum TaxID=384 RepID=UPI0013F17952|nr:hypothetical protein [Rhizobium leguminosarum]
MMEPAVSGKRTKLDNFVYRFYGLNRSIALSILTMRFSNAPRMLGTTMQLYIREVLAALIASPGSVSGEETTIRFGHPGIGLDNREY